MWDVSIEQVVFRVRPVDELTYPAVTTAAPVPKLLPWMVTVVPPAVDSVTTGLHNRRGH